MRYASNTCPFCAQDSEWSRLAAQLTQLGMPVVVVLPEPDKAYAADRIVPTAARQAAFVPMEWAKQLRMTLTPTVILFDATGSLMWYRLGVLSGADVESAVRAVTENALRREQNQ
jgi:hypothetical protein